MTDTRLPDSWLLKPDLDRLSDGAWRVLTRGLIFCNQQGTDGQIDALYMKYVYPFGPIETFVAELEEINWLVKTEGGYLIPDWEAKGQTTASQMELKRENNRLRQRKAREKAKTPERSPVTGNVTRDFDESHSRQNDFEQPGIIRSDWPEVRQPPRSDPSG